MFPEAVRSFGLRKFATVAVAAAIACVAVIGLRPTSGQAAGSIRLTPGVVITSSPRDFVVEVFNPTARPVSFTIAIFENDGFSVSSEPNVVEPQGFLNVPLNCSGACFGVPVVTTRSSRAIVSGLMTTSPVEHFPPGVWKRVR